MAGAWGDEPLLQRVSGKWGQLSIQLALSVLIGVALRLVIMPQALLSTQEKKGTTDYLIFFGVSKALSGLVGGALADAWGRRRTCLLGWSIAVCIVPLFLLGIHSAVLQNLANVMLGLSQGLTWELNIIVLMDLLGPGGRGVASALSNSVGYAASAACAPVAAGLVAEGPDGTKDATACIVALCGVLALALVLWACTEETLQKDFVESSDDNSSTSSASRSQGVVICTAGCGTRYLALCSMAGLTLNAATGLVWADLPLWAMAEGSGSGRLNKQQVAGTEAVYTWCKVVAMLASGYATTLGRVNLVVLSGFLALAVGFLLLNVQANHPPASWPLLLSSLCLAGIGCGAAYPALAAAVTDRAPDWRRASVYGAYRMWRDFGYAAAGLMGRAISSRDDLLLRRASAVAWVWAAVMALALTVEELMELRREASFQKDGDGPEHLDASLLELTAR